MRGGEREREGESEEDRRERQRESGKERERDWFTPKMVAKAYRTGLGISRNQELLPYLQCE